MKITLEYEDIENKLLILYLISTMDLPMSRVQIASFFTEKEFMNHFVILQNLEDMVERGFLEATSENAEDVGTTNYNLTEEGSVHLEHLMSLIPRPVRQAIDDSIDEIRGQIRKGFEKTANYFPNVENDEYIVKCGVYDDKRGTMLMEISMPVATREQAKFIQANWNENYTSIYQKVLAALTERKEESVKARQ